MSRTNLTAIALAAALPVLPTASAAQTWTTDPFAWEELGPGVHAAIARADVASWAFANSLVVIGTERVLVVDTQQNPAAAAALLAGIRRRTELPIAWVVNSHWHGDHVFGNVIYREADPDTRFIAHPATADSVRMAGSRAIHEAQTQARESADRLRARLADVDTARQDELKRGIELREAYARSLDSLRLVVPDLPVRDSLRLDLGGGMVADILHLGPAHTPGDIIVVLPEQGILAVGDLLEDGPLWLDGADAAGWLAALRRIRSHAPRILLPAHGRVHHDTGLLREHEQFLRDLVRPRGGRTFNRRS